MPKSNTCFWENKIKRNIARDKDVQHKLARMGWHCITVWECQLKPKEREKTLQSLSFTLNHIYIENHTSSQYVLHDDEFRTDIAAETDE